MGLEPDLGSATINVWGDFSVADMNGRSLAPRGLKANFLLAALVLSTDWRQSRAFLAQLLWSDRQPAQALASLRQALNEIRKALGPYADGLITDRLSVGLDQTVFRSDLDTPPANAELLTNLYPKIQSLQTWLRRMRALHSAKTVPEYGAPIVLLKSHDDTIHASVIRSGLADTLADWCANRVLKTSDSATSDALSSFIFENYNASSEDGVMSRLSLSQNQTDLQLWAINSHLPSDPRALIEQHDVHRLINQAVDRTVFEIGNSDGSEEVLQLQTGALGAVSLIFRNQGNDLDAAREELSRLYENCNRGVYLAWSAYVLTFFKAERNHSDLDALRDEARTLVARALELEPHSAMVLALCSYVTSYLIGDKSTGYYLGTRAIELNRSNPLAWIFRGAANFYGSDPEQAYRDIAFARSIAGDGPYRYVVEFYGCIAATLTNRLPEAERLGKLSSSLSPTFKAPLRYLAMIHAANGDDISLDSVIRQIRVVEPDFELGMLAEASYPVQAMRQSDRFKDALLFR